MGTKEAPGEDPVISRLEGLIGGNFVPGKILVDRISDPDESASDVSVLLDGPTDNLDALDVIMWQLDPLQLGILTGELVSAVNLNNLPGPLHVLNGRRSVVPTALIKLFQDNSA